MLILKLAWRDLFYRKLCAERRFLSSRWEPIVREKLKKLPEWCSRRSEFSPPSMPSTRPCSVALQRFSRPNMSCCALCPRTDWQWSIAIIHTVEHTSPSCQRELLPLAPNLNNIRLFLFRVPRAVRAGSHLLEFCAIGTLNKKSRMLFRFGAKGN